MMSDQGRLNVHAHVVITVMALRVLMSFQGLYKVFLMSCWLAIYPMTKVLL